MANDNELQLEGLEAETKTDELEGSTEGVKLKDKDKQKLKLKLKQYSFIGLIIGVAVIIIIALIMGIVSSSKKPSNIAPYCALTQEQGKTCKIHNVKHTAKDLKKLTIRPEEMEIQKELVNEILAGAYFDGKKLYKVEQAQEILDLKETFEEEKATLFERYLEGSLADEEQLRYNFLIEELGTLEETIIKLDIQGDFEGETTKEELEKQVSEATGTIARLTQEIEQLKAGRQVQAELIEQVTNGKSSDPINTEVIRERELIIPKDIEQASTVKKSLIYN